MNNRIYLFFIALASTLCTYHAAAPADDTARRFRIASSTLVSYRTEAEAAKNNKEIKEIQDFAAKFEASLLANEQKFDGVQQAALLDQLDEIKAALKSNLQRVNMRPVDERDGTSLLRSTLAYYQAEVEAATDILTRDALRTKIGAFITRLWETSSITEDAKTGLCEQALALFSALEEPSKAASPFEPISAAIPDFDLDNIQPTIQHAPAPEITNLLQAYDALQPYVDQELAAGHFVEHLRRSKSPDNLFLNMYLEMPVPDKRDYSDKPTLYRFFTIALLMQWYQTYKNTEYNRILSQNNTSEALKKIATRGYGDARLALLKILPQQADTSASIKANMLRYALWLNEIMAHNLTRLYQQAVAAIAKLSAKEVDDNNFDAIEDELLTQFFIAEMSRLRMIKNGLSSGEKVYVGSQWTALVGNVRTFRAKRPSTDPLAELFEEFEIASAAKDDSALHGLQKEINLRLNGLDQPKEESMIKRLLELEKKCTDTLDTIESQKKSSRYTALNSTLDAYFTHVEAPAARDELRDIVGTLLNQLQTDPTITDESRFWLSNKASILLWLLNGERASFFEDSEDPFELKIELYQESLEEECKEVEYEADATAHDAYIRSGDIVLLLISELHKQSPNQEHIAQFINRLKHHASGIPPKTELEPESYAYHLQHCNAGLLQFAQDCAGDPTRLQHYIASQYKKTQNRYDNVSVCYASIFTEGKASKVAQLLIKRAEWEADFYAKLHAKYVEKRRDSK